MPTPTTSTDPRHAQIDQLAQQIDQQRAQLGLVEPGTGPAIAAMTATAWKADPQCHPGQSEICTQSCTLSDSICGNADKICQLASQLAGDSWAEGKCNAAKQTCSAAHDKCCACAP
jgi:hypothetical protein